MVTLDQLYDRAYNDGIEVDDVRMQELRAVSFPEGWIAMDSSKYDSLLEFKCDLAHEIGHCETGSFYNIYSPFDLKEKCERKANKRAAEILMPLNEVRHALRRGITSAWALAEYFEVTEDFATMALEIYADDLHGHEHKHAVGLPPMMRASDLLPKQPPKPQRHVAYVADWNDDIYVRLPTYDDF